MRVTQWGEYGILCSAYLAEMLLKGHESVSAADIAENQKIDLQYTQQILQRLRKGGIIDSIRGPQGGYKLSRAATDINLRDILLAAEGDTFEVICEHRPLNEERCHTDQPCNLRPIWFKLKEHINTFLTSHTLDEIVASPLVVNSESETVQISKTRH